MSFNNNNTGSHGYNYDSYDQSMQPNPQQQAPTIIRRQSLSRTSYARQDVIMNEPSYPPPGSHMYRDPQPMYSDPQPHYINPNQFHYQPQDNQPRNPQSRPPSSHQRQQTSSTQYHSVAQNPPLYYPPSFDTQMNHPQPRPPSSHMRPSSSTHLRPPSSHLRSSMPQPNYSSHQSSSHLPNNPQSLYSNPGPMFSHDPQGLNENPSFIQQPSQPHQPRAPEQRMNQPPPMRHRPSMMDFEPAFGHEEVSLFNLKL